MGKAPVNLFIIEDLIRHGKLVAARKEVQNLAKRRLPVESLVRVAAFARRVNLSLLALRLLHLRIRPNRLLTKPATPEEKGEYAINLIRMGATTEAELLLDGLKPSPLVLFAYGALMMSRWDYVSAKGYWKKYLVKAKSYERTVGRVNLVASLIGCHELEDAHSELEQLMDLARKNRHRLLYANCLELAAQISIRRKDFTEAAHVLDQAERILAERLIVDSFFVKKWRTFLNCFHLSDKKKVKAEINTLRLAASKIKHWETVRDCDRFLAIQTVDETLLQRVYFGTPYAAFRKRLVEEFPKKIEIPNVYQLTFKKTGTPFHLDLKNGKLLPPAERLTQTGYRLIRALCGDFYKPSPVANLHTLVYPGEYFNPENSQNKVHQSMFRLRSWFAKQGVNLGLDRVEGGFCISEDTDFTIEIPKERNVGTKTDWQMEKLRKQWGTKKFSVAQVNKLLGTSPRTSLRLLQNALEKKLIARQGKRRGTLYHFIK